MIIVDGTENQYELNLERCSREEPYLSVLLFVGGHVFQTISSKIISRSLKFATRDSCPSRPAARKKSPGGQEDGISSGNYIHVNFCYLLSLINLRAGLERRYYKQPKPPTTKNHQQPYNKQRVCGVVLCHVVSIFCILEALWGTKSI
jgi:hypothetical protein